MQIAELAKPRPTGYSKSLAMLVDSLALVWTARAAQTTLALARERSAPHPEEIKTDGLRSYRQALPRAFPTRVVIHTVSQGIKAEINNNRSERLQGTFRDRDKTLRSLKGRDTGQAYIDDWCCITTISGLTRH